MPLLNFMPRFVDPIRLGTKHQTIRARRKIPIKPGDLLYLYCGARTAHCFKTLNEAVPCTKIREIIIRIGPMATYVEIDGTRLARDEKEQLALSDGFQSFADMETFWKDRPSFEGNIIHWR